MREALATHASHACRTLRDEGLAARAVQVFYHTGRHGNGPHRSASLGLPLTPATNATDRVVAATHALLARSWAARDAAGRPFRYKKAGVMLLDLCPADAQADLFAPVRPERQHLYAAMDALNRRFGRHEAPAVQVASAHLRAPGIAPAWATVCEASSPAYTTRLGDLPTVAVAACPRPPRCAHAVTEADPPDPMRRPSSRSTVVGFVAPVVAESQERRLDLNEVVGLTEAGRLAGRYLLSVDGFVPGALSLRAGDLAVVDRTRQPQAGDVVVVERDGILAVASEGETRAVLGVVTHFLVGARER